MIHRFKEQLIYSNNYDLYKDYTIHKYRKQPYSFAVYNSITGNNNRSYLLSQIIYWFEKMEFRPFYKFKTRPSILNPFYKPEHEWVVRLGMTIRMFDWALKFIATNANLLPKTKNRKRETIKDFKKRMKARKRKLKTYDLQPGETEEERKVRIEGNLCDYLKCCILYWTDKRTNLTYYYIDDVEFLKKLLKENIDDKIESDKYYFNGQKFIEKPSEEIEIESKVIKIDNKAGGHDIMSFPLYNKYYSKEYTFSSSVFLSEIPHHKKYVSVFSNGGENDKNSSNQVGEISNMKTSVLNKNCNEISSSKNAPHFPSSETRPRPPDGRIISFDSFHKLDRLFENEFSIKDEEEGFKLFTKTHTTSEKRTKLSSRTKNKHSTSEENIQRPDDEIDKLLDLWNELDHVTHHKNKNTKVYEKCRKLIGTLHAGTFVRKHSIDEKYAEKYIDPKYLGDYKFSFHEIKQGFIYLDRFLSGECDLIPGKPFISKRFMPKTKNLPYLLHNDLKNTSYFLMVLSNPPKPTMMQRIDLDDLPYDYKHFSKFLKLLNYSDQENEECRVNLACGLKNLINFHHRNRLEFRSHRLINLDLFLELYRNFLSLKFKFVKPILVNFNGFNWEQFLDFVYEQCHEDIGEME